MDGTSDNLYPTTEQINNSLGRKPLMRTPKDCDRDIEVQLCTTGSFWRGCSWGKTCGYVFVCVFWFFSFFFFIFGVGLTVPIKRIMAESHSEVTGVRGRPGRTEE